MPGIFYRIILLKKMLCCAMEMTLAEVAKEDGLWCLTPLSTIYRSVLFVEKTGVLLSEKVRTIVTNFCEKGYWSRSLYNIEF